MRDDLKQVRRLRSFERAVLETMLRQRLAGPDDSILVALSGGPDSTALLGALVELQRAGVVGPITACHIDHQLRAGSGDDVAFCRSLCADLSVPLRATAVEVAGGNLQAAARRARYRALREAAAADSATRLATGHQRGDQAETVLARLLRGSGARGLAGIPIRRGIVIRPLLERTRSEVLGYLAERRLPFRIDPTNDSPRFERNRIRAEILPALEALRPGAEAAIARAAALLRDDDRALERLARAMVPLGATSAPVEELLGAPRPVRARAVRRLWKEATGARRGLEGHHVEAVVRLFGRGRPGQVSLPGGLVATVRGGALRIAPP